MKISCHIRPSGLFLLCITLLCIFSCKKEDSSSSGSPTITTSAVTEITYHSAICGGNVTSPGNSAIIARGICWSTSVNPSILNTHTVETGETGAFTSQLSDLSPNTRYFVRAYATNSGFTSYGEQKEFTTLSYSGPSANLKANTTIAELRVKYPGVCDSINDTLIISGLVTANDESGNLYKKLVIQDQTAGLEVEINRTALFEDFKIGQRVFIKCKGLFLGRYHNLPQLGSIYMGAIGQIAAADIYTHIFPDGLPGMPPDPLILDPTGLNVTLLNRFIRLENVKFTDPGIPWADTDASGSRLLEGVGNYFCVRTSNYANFGSKSIPFGIGSIQGILEIYGNSYQLILRDTNDIIGFDNVAPLYWETFKTGMGSLLVKSVSGDQRWGYNQMYSCAEITGYASGNHPNEDWLIIPDLNLSNVSSANLSFKQAIKYCTPEALSVNHTVWISKDYNGDDPSNASWEQLSVLSYPPGNDWTYYTSGLIPIPAAYLNQSKVSIGFRYFSSMTVCSTWQLKDIVLE